jgi:hypothetical protein
MLLRKFKIGEKQSAGVIDDQYDFKSYIKAKTKIREASKEEQETLLKKYLGKQYKSLPSDILADVFEEDKE